MFFEMGASRNRLAFYNIVASRRCVWLRNQDAKAKNGESYDSTEILSFEEDLAMAA